MLPFSWAALLVLYLWFWNQIFTWVGDNRIQDAKCSRSGADKYLCCLNLLSSSKVCCLENKTLRFRFLDMDEPPLLVSSSSSIISSPSSSMSTSSVSEPSETSARCLASWCFWWSCCNWWRYFLLSFSIVWARELRRWLYESSVRSVSGDVLSGLIGWLCWCENTGIRRKV